MSSPLAIAAVTAVLKDMLNDGLLNHDLSNVGSFGVTALPPDRVSTGLNEPNQLNLFLYQVTANQGWRNQQLPSLDSRGQQRLSSPPLALDLHYLLTAYGSQDLNAEILLGYAMYILHQTPVLTRAQLRVSLGAPSPVDGTILPSPFGSLSAIDLADQVEMVKISPVYLSTEELSKIWTAMQARYRPSMAYMVSVVLIQDAVDGKAAPPVLQRGAPVAQGSAPPVVSSARAAASDLLPAIRLGDDVLISGLRLGDPGIIAAIFEEDRSGSKVELVPTPGPVSSQLFAHVPSIGEDANAMNKWAIGVYEVSLRVNRQNSPSWTTNSVPVALAPIIAVSPLSAAAGDELTMTCTPRLTPEQETRALLIFGDRLVAADSVTNPGDTTQPTTLTFTIPAVDPGDYIVRLRVEGIDSIPAVFAGTPPTLQFDTQQKVKIS
jgi:uncharacterized protein DUF4255